MSEELEGETFSPEKFRANLADAVDPGTSEVPGEDVRFREMEMWDSIASVSVVAMVYAEYDVQISGDELVGCDTVAQLTELVGSKLNS